MKGNLSFWAKKAEALVEPDAAQRKKADAVALSLTERCAGPASGAGARVVLGGSYAHDTWLPAEADIDAFLVFPPSLGKERLAEVGLAVAREALRGLDVTKRFSEHPYLEAVMGGVRVNVVPCLGVKHGEWISAADRSPHHTLYM
ncbi:MAG: nucleotidyltransferase domain-containing protein, partial [Nitrososphaerota archaeon]|nr:nucleotidyltransferase domain-containing protein [Nitrososphaerota archaeon]